LRFHRAVGNPNPTMPFIRKTPRRPSRHVITLSQLTESNWQVTTEMERLGFWRDELDEVDVYFVPSSSAFMASDTCG
jgi:hypothetical protein